MNHSSLLAWRIALLSSLGLVGCSGEGADSPLYASPSLHGGSANSPPGSSGSSGSTAQTYLTGGVERLPVACPSNAANQCVTDADCNSGFMCECSAAGSVCRFAGCVTSADCPTGALCIQTVTFQEACTVNGPVLTISRPDYNCQTLDDDCALDADCGSAVHCIFDGASHRCLPPRGAGGCAVPGRPFLIEGEARVAELVLSPRNGSCHAANEGLTVAERQLLTEHWTSIALMEHASIAAFARFTLQLLHLGAPADLVERSIQAQRDEALHTRLVLELAQRYAGADIELGRLAVSNALDDMDLRSIVIDTVLEGCIGETVAALEAEYALERAGDPEVKRALGQIVVDEKEHADLAWRFVQWAIITQPSLAADVLAAVGAQAGGYPSPCETRNPCVLSHHGYIAENERRALRTAALRSIVAPVADALCATAIAA